MLITLLIPTSGTARVLGHDAVAAPRDVRRHIGYVFGGDRGLYERLNAYDNLRYFAELYGVPPREQRARIGELVELVGLTGREKERVEGFSRGMRQRLHIARGLLHDPDTSRRQVDEALAHRIEALPLEADATAPATPAALPQWTQATTQRRGTGRTRRS